MILRPDRLPSFMATRYSKSYSLPLASAPFLRFLEPYLVGAEELDEIAVLVDLDQSGGVICRGLLSESVEFSDQQSRERDLLRREFVACGNSLQTLIGTFHLHACYFQ